LSISQRKLLSSITTYFYLKRAVSVIESTEDIWITDKMHQYSVVLRDATFHIQQAARNG